MRRRVYLLTAVPLRRGQSVGVGAGRLLLGYYISAQCLDAMAWSSRPPSMGLAHWPSHTVNWRESGNQMRWALDS